MAELNLAGLNAAFAPDELEWRIQQSGIKNGRPWAKCLVYVTARAIFNRLDSCVGPENWCLTEPTPVYAQSALYKGTKYNKTTYSFNVKELDDPEMQEVPNTLLGFTMGISIRINGEWVTRYDGADVTDFEPFKGGISSAIKRAGVPWGIGRYLYTFDEGWANFGPEAKDSKLSAAIYNKDSSRTEYHNWLPPEIPADKLPEGWSGNQFAHLGCSNSNTFQLKHEPAEKPKPSTQVSTDGDSIMKKMSNRIIDMHQKTILAKGVNDRATLDEMETAVERAKEYFGEVFSTGQIDENELRRLQGLLKTVEDELNGKG